MPQHDRSNTTGVIIMGKNYFGYKNEDPGPGNMYVEPLPLRGRLALKHYIKHSPDGFNWGYGGSGAVELARCLLWDFLEEEPEPSMYKAFAQTVIARLPSNWMLTSDFIDTWVTKYNSTEEKMGRMPTEKETP